jgi:hypothetical protein
MKMRGESDGAELPKEIPDAVRTVLLQVFCKFFLQVTSCLMLF